ncbi:MAG: DUF951 domain-containing protein [Clostridiales bacterium]|nr:DUF951 domain-containing protein [Clostridiales bacterium]
MALIYEIGTVVETKKPHPCGGTLWTVVRTGADYKIKCNTCGRLVMLSPDELKKRIKRVIGE